MVAKGIGRPKVVSGLQDVSFQFELPRSKVDLREVTSTLGLLPGFTKRRDGEGVRGTLESDGRYRNLHAHCLFEKAESKSKMFCSLGVHAGSYHSKTKPGLTVTEFLPRARTVLAGAKLPLAGVLSSHFDLATTRWTPTLPLPFNLSGLDQIPGVPQIAGVDLVFRSTKDDQPVVRAFVSTFDPLPHFVVRFMSIYSSSLEDTFWDSVLRFAGEKLLMFAKPQVEGTGDKT